MTDILKQFEHIYKVVTSTRFLKGEGIGGEIPFYIAPYDATKELQVRNEIALLIKRMNTSGVTVKEINIYDVVCNLLETEMGFDDFIEMEKDMDKDEFKDAIQSLLEINEVLIPHIQSIVEESDAKVFFLTSIGLVFPYIRSHNILNNLQNVVKHAPLLTFFPGEYDGHTLNLFGKLKDDNYYRAFNIFTIGK